MGDVEIFWDVAQGSDEWRRLRLGLPTASEFADILAKGQGKVRKAYLNRLAAERLTGEPQDIYSNRHMDRGKALEDEARDLYGFVSGLEPRLVGFVRNGIVGCSPDGLIGDDGVLEIKTRLPPLMIDLLVGGEMPPEYRAQVQGALWVCERDWADVMIYWPGLDYCCRRIERDDEYICKLAEEVGMFCGELAAVCNKLGIAA
jgi:hypothetical protein